MPAHQDTNPATPADLLFPAWMPPHLRLMQLIAAKWITQPLLALAHLGVADLLQAGPRTVEDLAQDCGVLTDPLRRCLRAAAGVGVFAETEDGCFTLTPMAHHLSSGVDLSLRDLTLLLGSEPTTRSFAGILDVLKTGRPSFQTANGTAFFDYLDRSPELGTIYQGAWAPLTAGVGLALLKAVDFAQFDTVADLGGGNGTLLRAILDAHPSLKGVLMDRPKVLEEAHPGLTQGQLSQRVELFAGALPRDVPTQADAYLIKNTLHCFDETVAAETLLSIRAAIGDRKDARLFLIESVITPGNEYDWGRFVDIEVMVNCGGRVHTLPEWEKLLDTYGFVLDDAKDLLPPQWLLTARPK
ncbi:O-methyltransferase [Streptomyces sp. 1114.5]|uniref:methyltransferase n=1 Tax=Streptomyces sp. 1114.5 TaxID=1938830 RepID=UPI000F26F6F0|nr:methyltransferase [Streptomyces sp. 1114.5]RKT11321.1 O-methyltransferase [Streptomyces sp. 1114.5]